MAEAFDSDVGNRLKTWILAQGSLRNPDLLTDTTDIVQDGFLDSLGLMSLIAYVEEIRGKPLSERELQMENFATIRSIVRTLFAPAPAHG